jgi:hypothetical protein
MTIDELMPILNEIGLKSTTQRFFYIDEIPKPVYNDLNEFLIGKTIGVRNNRKVIYHADIMAWLDKVWHKGLNID